MNENSLKFYTLTLNQNDILLNFKSGKKMYKTLYFMITKVNQSTISNMYFLIPYLDIVVFQHEHTKFIEFSVWKTISQNVMSIDIEVRNKRERFESNVPIISSS